MGAVFRGIEMGILFFDESHDFEDNITQDNLSLTRHFKAQTTTFADATYTNLLTNRPDLAPGSPHPETPNAYVIAFDPRRRGDSYVLDIQVRYAIIEPVSDNPLMQPAEISFDAEDESVAVLRDADDVWMRNTGGTLFAPVEDDLASWVVNVTKNLSTVPTWITYYENAVNQDAVTIRNVPFAAETLRLKGLRIPKVQYSRFGVAYFAVSFRLVHKADGWFWRRPNVGTMEYVEVGEDFAGELPITLGATLQEMSDWARDRITKPQLEMPGERVDAPVFLNEEGFAFRTELDDDPFGPVRTPLASEIIVLEFKRGHRLPFTYITPLFQ